MSKRLRFSWLRRKKGSFIIKISMSLVFRWKKNTTGNSLVTSSSAVLMFNKFKTELLFGLGQAEIHICSDILHLTWQNQHLIPAWNLCSRATNCRCVQREGLLAGRDRTWGLLYQKPDLLWEALIQGRAFCEEKVVRDAGGSYERYGQKEKSYLCFCNRGI